MGRVLIQTLLQRRHTDGQQTYEKVVSITNYQGDANQNQNNIYIIPVRMAIFKKLTNKKYW